MGFPRQDYWCGLPFTSPECLPDRGIKPMSAGFPALAGRLFTTETPGKPKIQDRGCITWENLLLYVGNLWFPLLKQRYIKRSPPPRHSSFLRGKEFPRIWNLYCDWLWQKNQSIQKLWINSPLYVKTQLGIKIKDNMTKWSFPYFPIIIMVQWITLHDFNQLEMSLQYRSFLNLFFLISISSMLPRVQCLNIDYIVNCWIWEYYKVLHLTCLLYTRCYEQD